MLVSQEGFCTEREGGRERGRGGEGGERERDIYICQQYKNVPGQLPPALFTCQENACIGFVSLCVQSHIYTYKASPSPSFSVDVLGRNSPVYMGTIGNKRFCNCLSIYAKIFCELRNPRTTE
jgi:hypothetical protein